MEPTVCEEAPESHPLPSFIMRIHSRLIGWILASLILWPSLACVFPEEDDDLLSATAFGTESLKTEPRTLAEKLENLGRVYKNDDHPILQEWWLLGRYHGQYYNADGSDALQDGWENRRFRIGSQARFFEKMTLHAQMVSGFDMNPFYNGFTELWT